MGASAPLPMESNMTGADLIRQEEHELGFERAYVDGLDRVDRRDRRGEIMSDVPSEAYKRGYMNIDWSKRA